MNGKLYVTYVNMMSCIFVDSLSKKRERDANLHHVHITLKSLICASYKHVLISPKKSYIKRWNNNFSSKKEIQNRKTLQNLFICSICD